MQENLLQFIWQYSLYQPANLFADNGEPVTVIQPGRRNANAGPDFLEAKVKVGNTILAGHVELHVRSSDWLKHQHQHDKAYHNVILHVVYEDDKPGITPHIPVLALANHIAPAVLDNYASLHESVQSIPCGKSIATVRDITKEAWLNRLLAERWEEKLLEWKEQLTQSKEDWQSLLYWRMAYNFGFKVNAAPFLMLAQSIPLNILAKHREHLLQLEALLFGQAGMLEDDFKDDYPNELKKEYNYLAKKYKLQPVVGHLWKFLRLRPANFPTIRIAQFAALIHRSVHLFSKIIETHDAKDIQLLFQVSASSYWDTHYRFDEEPADKPTVKRLGKSSVQNIIINTIAPMQFLYAGRQGSENHQEKAINLISGLPAERNAILDKWRAVGYEYPTAAQSQALLQLYNRYCTSKRCLECSIGHSLLKLRPVE